LSPVVFDVRPTPFGHFLDKSGRENKKSLNNERKVSYYSVKETCNYSVYLFKTDDVQKLLNYLLGRAEVTKPIRIKDSAEFDSLMKGLARDIVNANVHYRLHKSLNDAIPEYVTELNQSAAFWNLTISAQIDASLLRLCRAYDSHTASLSLPRLLATA
jgi:AbiU2